MLAQLTQIMRPLLIPKNLILIPLIFITSSCAQTTENEQNKSAKITVLPEYIFSASTEVSSQVKETLITAKNHNKKALFVLGAQWCHDSKGLANKFSTPQMQKILSDNYQVLFIDVGYLEKGFDVVKQFDLPVYYGTPTVMVVNPNSGKIVNRATMQKWLNADKVPLNEYIEYFNGFASSNSDAAVVNPTMEVYLDEIKKFEQQQAVRLKEAYAVVGPLLQQYMESDNKKAPEEFSNKWQQVHDLRYRIQDDIQVLLTQARANVKAESTAPLTLPVYPAFTWE